METLERDGAAPPEPGLRALIAPLGLDAFRRRHWAADLHWIGHGPAEALGGLCEIPELRDVGALLRAHRGKTRVVFNNPEGEYREAEVSSGQALSLYEGGLTVCISNLEQGVPTIAGWVAGLARDLGLPAGAAQCNAYASPREKGFAKHCDNREVLVVQIQGEKRWRIAPNREVRYPTQNYIPANGRPAELLSYCLEDVSAEMPADAITVDMKPGSVLFLPRGTWHATEAALNSLSLTFGFFPPTRVDVVLAALRRRLLAREAWRAPLRPAGALEAEAAGLAALLPDLVREIEALSPRDLLAAALPAPPPLYIRHPGARMAIAEEAGGARVSLDVPGEDLCEIEAASETLPLFRWIAAREEPFSAEEAGGAHPRLSPGLARSALRILVEGGYLRGV
jgi:50S ribosomal protein L16 3-hydroxylase